MCVCSCGHLLVRLIVLRLCTFYHTLRLNTQRWSKAPNNSIEVCWPPHVAFDRGSL